MKENINLVNECRLYIYQTGTKNIINVSVNLRALSLTFLWSIEI
jgi:hypothetical protein